MVQSGLNEDLGSGSVVSPYDKPIISGYTTICKSCTKKRGPEGPLKIPPTEIRQCGSPRAVSLTESQSSDRSPLPTD